MNWLVPQRIKIEDHNRYVVEFREEDVGTRAFGSPSRQTRRT